MLHKWNRICTKLKRLKDSNCSEKEYENKVCECFDYLLDWDDEVMTQVHIPIGSVTTLIPDIVISADGIYQFVIELKKPTNSLTERQCVQLFSYMKQLKLDFGLYIGENIQLYYDNPDDKEDPVLIKTFEFEENTTDGKKFVELFDRKAFNNSDLRNYCKDLLAARRKMDELNAEIEELCSKTGEELIREFLIEHVSKKGYDRISVEEKLSAVCVSITNNANSQGHVDRYGNIMYGACAKSADFEQNRSFRRYRHYVFEGKQYHVAGELAFEIIKRFVKDNSGLTYSKICDVLPECARPRTKKEYYEKKTCNDINYDRRWSAKYGPMFISADNVEFVIHTGYSYRGYGVAGPDNICDLIDFARRQGYDVKEI